jgi:hypothetical protein
MNLSARSARGDKDDDVLILLEEIACFLVVEGDVVVERKVWAIVWIVSAPCG